MMVIIFCIIGIILGAITVYFIQAPKIKATQQLDQEIANRNEWLKAENAALIEEKVSILSQIPEAEKQLKEAYRIAENDFERYAEKTAASMSSYREECNDAYLTILEDLADNIKDKISGYQNNIKDYENKLKDLDKTLADKQALVIAAVEANKRIAEMKDQQNFYRLILEEDDITEIQKLKEVIPYLRDSEPLNKVIWKVYYEKPYTSLIGRVIGTDTKTGIYKITNITNGMCYVGQAVNVGR